MIVRGGERVDDGTNDKQNSEAKRLEIIGSYGRRSCARKLDELGPSAGAGAERCEAARKFYRAGSEPALEFGRAICYGAAEGAADPADRSAGTTGNAAELFPNGVHS